MAEEDKEEKGGRRRLSDLVVRAGAVATALGAIAGLVTLLWPDSPSRLAASLDNLAVDTNVSLSEFSARQRVAGAKTSGRQLALVHGDGREIAPVADHRPGWTAIRLAQSPAGAGTEPSAPETQSEPDAEAPTPDSGEKGSPTEPGEGEGPPTKAGEEGSTTPDPGGSESGADSTILNRAKKKLPPQRLPDGCDYRGLSVQCGAEDEEMLRSLLPATDIDEAPGGGAVADAEALVKVLENTRARPVSSGGSEPLGVTLSFDLEIEGFTDARAEVRWSLYDAGARKRVPRDWLVNRRALVVRPEAAFDRASAEFWVPVPERKGPFFVRLSVYDEEGQRLAFSDSESFR